MEMKHWLFLLLVFIIGYVVGIKFPFVGQKIASGVSPSAVA